MPDRLRIVLTIHHRLDRASGAPGVTLALADAYRRLGHEVEVLGFDSLPVRGDRTANLVFPALVAARLARAAARVDVVEASMGDAAWWCRLPPRDRAVLVVRSHGLEHVQYDDQRDDAARRHERLSLRYRWYRERVNLPRVARTIRAADAVLVLNARELAVAVARLGADPGRVHVVPQGVDDDVLVQGARRPLDASEPVIVAIARWARSKGTEYLVPAVAAVMGARPDVRMRFLGTGVDPSVVRDEFPRTVRDRVEVVPRFERPELVGLVGSARVVVHPSLREASPVGLLEGMALGLAPVATAIPGITEVLGPGTGILVPPRDVAALRDALDAVVGDPARAAQLGAAARASVADRAWSAVADASVERFRALVAARREGS